MNNVIKFAVWSFEFAVKRSVGSTSSPTAWCLSLSKAHHNSQFTDHSSLTNHESLITNH
jgi:hypothetical protein